MPMGLWDTEVQGRSKPLTTPAASTGRKQATQFLKKYGVGMACGLLAVHLTKKLILKIPLVGCITRPVLNLLPTLLVGPALGAAVCYGLHEGEGDLLAARQPVQRGLGRASRELEGRVRKLQQGLDERMPRLRAGARQLEAEQQEMMASLSDAVQGMERSLTPALERRTREAQQQLEQLKSDWHRA